MNIDGVVREILVELLQRQADIVLVNQGQISDGLKPTLAQRVDVVLLSAPEESPLPEVASQLLSHNPHLRVFVVSPSVDTAMIYWLALQHRRLESVSGESILASIRTVHQPTY
jgi:DNA-binding NarL/FixJ family response regulator